ncbi:ribonuclease III [Kaarinaea lacus]
MTGSLDGLIRRLGYQFRDELLLETALTHRSKGSSNNERLEFLGDAVLGLVVTEILFSQFEKASEGKLSRFRSLLVKKDTLAEVARHFSLGDYLRLGAGELKSGGFRRDSILADAMEAIIGAMYLDGGLDAARKLIKDSLGDRIEKLSSKGSTTKDPKTYLQEYLQARHLALPSYEVVTTTGDDHDQNFEVSCSVAVLEEPVMGAGTSRRRAEQDAAQRVLDILDIE